MDKKQVWNCHLLVHSRQINMDPAHLKDRLKSIQGEQTVKHIAFMMDRKKAVEIVCVVVAMICNDTDNAEE
jgi:rRNA processing protein Krr1/Pno1